MNNTGIILSGGFIPWYPLITVSGALAGIVLCAWLVRRLGYDSEHLWRGLVPVLIGGLVGARLWFMTFPPQAVITNGGTPTWFFSHFFDLTQGVIAIWTGGFGLIGGLIGAAFGLWLYLRLNKQSVATWFDIATLGLLVAQAIGRLADGAAQDLYGAASSWGMLISDPAQRVAPYTDLAAYPLESTHFQPVYLYEFAFTAILFFVLLWVFQKHQTQAGDLALLYVIGYGTGRVLLESLRVNQSWVAGIDISQAAAGLATALAFITFLRRFLRRRRANMTSAQKDLRDSHKSTISE